MIALVGYGAAPGFGALLDGSSTRSGLLGRRERTIRRFFRTTLFLLGSERDQCFPPSDR
jgi:hypothetical protein